MQQVRWMLFAGGATFEKWPEPRRHCEYSSFQLEFFDESHFLSCFQLVEAKELYKATHESTFNLDHAWGILKDTPKWQATQTEFDLKQKKPKVPKQPITPIKTSSAPPTDKVQASSP